MNIWDLHAHLSGIDGSTPEERMARLVELADRMGIERLILFMGYPFSYDPGPETLREQNDQVLQALSHHHDRAFGFVYVSPKHVETSLAEIERCVVNGPMVGLKLWVAARCNALELDPIVRKAAELNAIVFQHTWYKSQGNLPGESTPEELAELAARHPDAKIICGHTGSDWERGIRAIRSCENVSVDLGGNDPTAGFVEMAVRELGAERVLYGSDVPGRSFATQLGKVYGARIPEAARRLILGDNLKRLLQPILMAKGVRV